MPNNTNEKPTIEDGDCEVLCSVCSKPLGEVWSTCLCYPSHGKWHLSCDPHESKEKWWEKEPYKIRGPLSDWFDIEKIVAESRRLARLEMAREMIDVVNANKNTVGPLAAIVSRLTTIIQEEEKV